MTQRHKPATVVALDAIEMAETSGPTARPSADLTRILRQSADAEPITTAVVASISPDGIARVILSGETQPCDAASTLQFQSAADATAALLGRTVLVLLNRHTTQPVILGTVSERLWTEDRHREDADVAAASTVEESPSPVVARRRFEVDVPDEIRFTCGKSSLVMRRDGTVVVRGVKIISRASETNKIRGGTVSVN